MGVLSTHLWLLRSLQNMRLASKVSWQISWIITSKGLPRASFRTSPTQAAGQLSHLAAISHCSPTTTKKPGKLDPAQPALLRQQQSPAVVIHRQPPIRRSQRLPQRRHQPAAFPVRHPAVTIPSSTTRMLPPRRALPASLIAPSMLRCLVRHLLSSINSTFKQPATPSCSRLKAPAPL